MRISPKELRPNGSIEESVEERVDEEGPIEEPFCEMSQSLQYLRLFLAHLERELEEGTVRKMGEGKNRKLEEK